MRQTACCLVLLAIVPAGAQEPNDGGEAVRRYEDGPLTAADFLAPIPKERLVGENVVADAYTTTKLRFEYRYSYRVQQNVVTAKVDSIQLSSVMLPNQSWNARKDDRELVDHEQGHFDIAQAAALEARLELLELQKAGPLFQTTARTVDEAVGKLEEKVQAFMKRYTDAIRRQDQEYDRLTRHGQISDEQAKHRARQIAALESLTEKLQPTASE